MSIKCFILSLSPFVSLVSLLSLQLRVPCDFYYSTLPFVSCLDQPIGITWWSWLRSRLQWLSDNWGRVPAWEILGELSMGDTQECSAEIRCAAMVQATSTHELHVAGSAGHTISCAVHWLELTMSKHSSSQCLENESSTAVRCLVKTPGVMYCPKKVKGAQCRGTRKARSRHVGGVECWRATPVQPT